MTGLSLMEFVKKQRRADCAVCQLPEPLRRQMLSASEKKIKRAVVLSWLKEEHGIEISNEALTSHHSAHHDESEG